MTDVIIQDIGPIKSLEITLPDSGVVVLKGSHGSGKSTALRAVQRRMGGPGPDLSVHDGAKKGVLSLGEARLSVTKSRTSTLGELEILGIESDLDIGSLVDPGIADHEKADGKRIKALISLTGVEPDPTIFHSIVGGEAQYVALGIDDKGADVLTLAARVKRALESLARSREEVADSYAERARAAKKASEDAPEGEANETKLAEALAKAQSTLDAMRSENQRSDEMAASAAVASQQLAELGELSDDHGALLAQARSNTQLAISRRADADGMRKQADKLDAEAMELESDADDLLARAEKAQKAAEKREKLLAEATAAVPAGYSDEQMAEAAEEVDAARKAVENGALIRQAAAKAAEAESHATAAKVASKAARKLRDAAGAVDDALSKLLPDDCPLRVEAGRLVLETDRGKSEPFSDLSEGEKWQVAIRVACKKLPPGGLLTLEQSAWEGLAPSVKFQLDAEAKAQGVVILTAAVDDGELRAETVATPGNVA